MYTQNEIKSYGLPESRCRHWDQFRSRFQPHSVAARIPYRESDRTLVDILTTMSCSSCHLALDSSFHPPIFTESFHLHPFPACASIANRLKALSPPPSFLQTSPAFTLRFIHLDSQPFSAKSSTVSTMPSVATPPCLQFPSTSKSLQSTSLLSALSPRSWMASFGMCFHLVGLAIRRLCSINHQRGRLYCLCWTTPSPSATLLSPILRGRNITASITKVAMTCTSEL